MDYEKPRGLKILGKIDLTVPNEFDKKAEFPKPESYLQRLKVALADMTERLSSEYGDFFTVGGQMKMISRDADYDQDRMKEKIKGFAEDEFKTPEKFLADREKNSSNIRRLL